MTTTRTYTINEAAALTGLHGNTIRKKIKSGQLEASVHQGKFGEEYRIEHGALVSAGLLAVEGPLGGAGAEPVLDAELVTDGGSARAEAELSRNGREGGSPREAGGGESGALAHSTVAALGELFQRHEQAIFRLGYLQGELDRLKALAESAESLQQDRAAREQELQELRSRLGETERRAAESDALRRDLDTAQARLRELETARRELERLRQEAAAREEQLQALEKARQRPWWRFWGE